MSKRQTLSGDRVQSSGQSDRTSEPARHGTANRPVLPENPPDLGKKVVNCVVVANADGQRLDNYLMSRLKGAPRSLIYRIIRRGEVRVNSGRAKASRRLLTGDVVRIPPLRLSPPSTTPVVSTAAKRTLDAPVFEDEFLLVLDKPSGLAVHAGSTLDSGLVEQVRQQRSNLEFLELAHRLDRETSGCLVLAKDRKTLVGLHEQFRQTDGVRLRKRYQTLLYHGERRPPPLGRVLSCSQPLTDSRNRQQQARTEFTAQHRYETLSLMDVVTHTGRKHQIRRHAMNLSMPVAGDERYGDFALNRSLRKRGLKRLFLHAASIRFVHPRTGARLQLNSTLPPELTVFLSTLDRNDDNDNSDTDR